MSTNTDRTMHYIIALPPSGVPNNVMRAIKSIRKAHGVVHTAMYHSKKPFSRRPTKNKFVQTTFWIEFSDKPLPERSSPDWPLGTTQ